MIKAILLDIEGTTTPIDFVHKTLFLYSDEKMHEFVGRNFEALRSEIKQLKQEHASDSAYQFGFDEHSPGSVKIGRASCRERV